MENTDEYRVSLYPNNQNKKHHVVSLGYIHERITSGRKGLKTLTEYGRQALAREDTDAYKALKGKANGKPGQLLAMTPSGIFKKGTRSVKTLESHSGIVVIDIDGVKPKETLLNIIEHFETDPSVVMIFISPSGTGIKILFRIHPIPLNADEHKAAYQTIVEHVDKFRNEPDTPAFEVDTGGSDVSRLCFLAFDPHAYYNEYAVPIQWDREKYLNDIEESKAQQKEIDTETPTHDTDTFDVACLDYIPQKIIDRYPTWIEIGMGIKNAGGTVHDWIQASRKSIHFDAAECEEKWDTFKGSGITVATLYFYAKQGGYEPKRSHRKRQRSKPVKLKVVEEYTGDIVTIDTARKAIKSMLDTDAQVIALKADTGTGKTEQVIVHSERADTVINTQSSNLAKDISDRADAKGIIQYRYKGIEYKVDKAETVVNGLPHDSDNYFACPYSDKVTALQKKGYNYRKAQCMAQCEYEDYCGMNGYLSQDTHARNAQLLTTPFGTGFTDPRLRQWAKRFKPSGKDTMIYHDDIPIGSLMIEYTLSGKHLRQVMEDWDNTPVAEWAQKCLIAFTMRKWDILRDACVNISDADVELIQDALTRCIHPETGQSIEPDEYLQLDTVKTDTVEQCKKLPTVAMKGYDALTTLRQYFERYPRDIDLPIKYDPTAETLYYFLPPAPYLFNKTVRFVFGSATTPVELYKRVLPTAETIETPLTEWIDGSMMFQLETNRNPRRTILECELVEDAYIYQGLSKTGQRFYDRILSFAKAHPEDKHGLISFYNLINDKQDELDELGIETAHFGNVAGLDTQFKDVKCLHILGTPYITPDVIDQITRQYFGNDTEPLIRDDDGSLLRDTETHSREYVDDRADMIFTTLVAGEVRQSVRVRPNLRASVIVLWTSLFVSGYSDRTETTLFDENDWDTADNNLERLSEIATARHKALNSGNTSEVAETQQVSQRQAERLTKDARDQKKAERDAEVLELHKQGLSSRKIVEQTGISLTTVRRIIKGAPKTTFHIKDPLCAMSQMAHPATESDISQCVKQSESADKPTPPTEKVERKPNISEQVYRLWKSGKSNASISLVLFGINRELDVIQALLDNYDPTVSVVLRDEQARDESQTFIRYWTACHVSKGYDVDATLDFFHHTRTPVNRNLIENLYQQLKGKHR